MSFTHLRSMGTKHKLLVGILFSCSYCPRPILSWSRMMSECNYVHEYESWRPNIPANTLSLHWHKGELYRDYRMFIVGTEIIKMGERDDLCFVKIFKNTPNMPLYELREFRWPRKPDYTEIVVETELYTPCTFLNGAPFMSAFPEKLPDDPVKKWCIWTDTFEHQKVWLLDDYWCGSWSGETFPPDFSMTCHWSLAKCIRGIRPLG